ncbi:MAG TPA: glycosyltransferase family 39 protein [Planctomycetota bacterium]|nr:glycosyltransferase family 39 protein [Planctomycetota bacterium]
MSEPTVRPAAASVGLFRDDLRPALLLAAGCLASWIPSLPGRDLWAPNEPKFAEVAVEMVDRADYLVPHVNGEVYPDKPPLFFWMEVGSARLCGGFSEFALRLPSALAATALVLVTYRIGLFLFGRREAFFSAAILGTTRLLFEQATRAVMDPLFSLCVAAGMLAYARARGRGGWLAGAHFGLWWGLAILSKGYGLLLPALPAAVEYLVRTRGRPRSERLRGARPSFVALLVAAAIALAWFLPASLRQKEGLTLGDSLGKQVLGRVIAPWNHEQPPWYFLGTFPLDLLPWTPFLLLAIPSLRRAEGRDRDGIRFALAWLLPTFLFFSCVPSKRGIYLMPALPAAALLLGRTIGRLCEGKEPARPWASALEGFGRALAILGALLLLALPVGLRRLPEVGAPLLAFPGASLLALGALSLASYRRGGFPLAFALLPAGAAVAGAVLLGLLFPSLDPIKSPAPLARTLAALHRGEEVVFREVPPEGYRFYSRIPLRDAGGDPEFLKALGADPPAIGVTTEKAYGRLRGRLPSTIVRLAEDAVGHRDVVVLGRRRP